jgi:hypothetical protein
MDNRVAALGLATIAVAAVATQSQRSAGTAPAEPSSVAAPQAPPQKEPPLPPSPSPRGADLVHAFFGEHWPAASAAAPDTFALGTAIATLPDPYDSHLDWSFDAQLEAIRRAFETAGYVLDRFWLTGARDSATTPDSAAPRVGLREVRPGLMLFRRTAPDAWRLGGAAAHAAQLGVSRASERALRLGPAAGECVCEAVRFDQAPFRPRRAGPRSRLLGGPAEPEEGAEGPLQGTSFPVSGSPRASPASGNSRIGIR